MHAIDGQRMSYMKSKNDVQKIPKPAIRSLTNCIITPSISILARIC